MKSSSQLKPKARTGPKLRPRYCTICGVKCEGARQAREHCKGRTTQCSLCLYLAPLPGFKSKCPSCKKDVTEALAKIRGEKRDRKLSQ